VYLIIAEASHEDCDQEEPLWCSVTCLWGHMPLY